MSYETNISAHNWVH